jgi:glycosyltransferase involved in cell wall biosynthesis
VWLVNLFFGSGGTAPTGTLVESLAVALERSGFRAEVLTGKVGYNAPVLATSSRFQGKVHRLYSGPLDARGVGGRLLSWLAFYLALALFAFTRRLPDQVVLLTTPPFLHALFAFRNLFTRRKAVLLLWNQDTYPEVLAAVGLLRTRSLFYRWLLAVQCWGVRRTHTVVVLDRPMRQRLEQQGARRIRIIPNWISCPDTRAPAEHPLLQQLVVLSAPFRYTVLYMGNYGWGHNLEGLWRYLRRQSGQRTFFFLFVGGGEKWADVQRLQREHPYECLAVHSYIPRELVAPLIAQAHFGLVALERACAGLLSPSKIHDYLAGGKPLIYVGPGESNVAEALDQFACGFRLDEEDSEGWERLQAELEAADFRYEDLSANAARAFACRYNEEAGTAELVRLLGDPGGAC